MEQTLPLVSTIIAVYNGERYLAETIESAITQTYRNIEIIITDDGSTDGSRNIAQSFMPSVRYCHQLHSGIAAAWNHGIQLARGEYFAILDADDLWSKDKIQRQMDVFHENTGIDIVFGQVKEFHSPELSEEERQKIWCPDNMVPGVSANTMLVKRESFFRVGWFDTQWRRGIFNDWYLRASELGLLTHMLPNLVAQRRLHRKNHGIVNRDKSIDYVRILRASLHRRRRQDPH